MRLRPAQAASKRHCRIAEVPQNGTFANKARSLVQGRPLMRRGKCPCYSGTVLKKRVSSTAPVLQSLPGMDLQGNRSRKQSARDTVSLETILNEASAAGTALANLTGLKALMVAVLEDGIRHYLGRNPRLRNEAECWILAGHRSGPFSFSAVCDVLGLDPAAVRDAVRRMRRENREGRSLRRSRPNSRRRRKLSVR